jgi:hypothetical protein
MAKFKIGDTVTDTHEDGFPGEGFVISLNNDDPALGTLYDVRYEDKGPQVCRVVGKRLQKVQPRAADSPVDIHEISRPFEA